jgi:sucrose phosphorylase
MPEKNQSVGSGPMLNAYPDSLGGSMRPLVDLLVSEKLSGAFDALYVLPSVFHSDLDRGFSIIDYGLNRMVATEDDFRSLAAAGISLKLDFVLNHASVLSEQFQDIVKNGDASRYRDFFIDWNKFWAGRGTMTEAGYIQPDEALLQKMFFRKPGLPLLPVRFPDGREVPYWNTFYQKVQYEIPGVQELMAKFGLQYAEAEALSETLRACVAKGKRPSEANFSRCAAIKPRVIDLLESRRTYLGQMDLNIKSPLVWDYYEKTLATLAGYGAKIVRLDAFAYAPKEPGARNFLNDPGTWDLLARIKEIADRHGLTLLPEIHASYAEKIYERISAEGYLTYDFFLPGLLLDAFDRHTADALRRWIQELRDKKIKTVNMLGCHDGIPVLDLQGILAEDQIQKLIASIVARGGYVKDLHGQKNVYYQVNATYFSALGESERRLVMARALQIFMPGKPQVWYLDLFAGKNDHEAVRKAGDGGHKEINRTNLTLAESNAALDSAVVRKQLELLRFRNSFGAFGFDSDLELLPTEPHVLGLKWTHAGNEATLEADLLRETWTIRARDSRGNITEISDGFTKNFANQN